MTSNGIAAASNVCINRAPPGAGSKMNRVRPFGDFGALMPESVAVDVRHPAAENIALKSAAY
jgi:hypothetical protein